MYFWFSEVQRWAENGQMGWERAEQGKFWGKKNAEVIFLTKIDCFGGILPFQFFGTWFDFCSVLSPP